MTATTLEQERRARSLPTGNGHAAARPLRCTASSLVAFAALGLALSGCASGSAIRPCTQEAMTAPASNAAEDGADPTTTDPDKYKTVMENERVRVLRYHDSPGAKTQRHHHPASVLYALSAFRRRLTFPDGTSKERDFKPGDVMWVPAQTHIGENIGTTDTDVLLVEQKGK